MVAVAVISRSNPEDRPNAKKRRTANQKGHSKKLVKWPGEQKAEKAHLSLVLVYSGNLSSLYVFLAVLFS